MTENKPEFQKKILNVKTYNKIPHFSKSRLGIGDHYIDPKTELVCLKQVPDAQTLIIVQEKLDGSNVYVTKLDGKIIPLTRSGYDCRESKLEQHRSFAYWVNLREEAFSRLLGEGCRVVGEWIMQAHGTQYFVPSSADAFIAFDYFFSDNIRACYHEFLELVLPYDFKIPLLLHMGGSCSLNRAQSLMEKASPLHLTTDGYEGFIYRIEKNFIPNQIVKYVRHDKIDGKYFSLPEPLWNLHPSEIFCN